MSKTCIKCGESKPNTDFYAAKSNKDGLCNTCKVCAIAAAKARSDANPGAAAAKSRAWHKANRDKALATSKRWREANPEKSKALSRAWNEANPGASAKRGKEWRKANPDRAAEVVKAWHDANPECRPQSVKKWAKANPDKVNAFGAEYRAARLQASPEWANRSEISRFYAEAQRLSEETGIEHHVDHDVPLQGRNVCGLHVHENLCIMTAHENRKKSNRFDVG